MGWVVLGSTDDFGWLVWVGGAGGVDSSK